MWTQLMRAQELYQQGIRTKQELARAMGVKPVVAERLIATIEKSDWRRACNDILERLDRVERELARLRSLIRARSMTNIPTGEDIDLGAIKSFIEGGKKR